MSKLTTNVPSCLRLGARASPLSIAQANLVCKRLKSFYPKLKVEVVKFTTAGDRSIDRRLAEIGGKGLFAKEIEEALLACDIDAAVHSMKDLETQLPEGLLVGAVLPREDPRDAFIGNKVLALEALPNGALVGTASMRRQAQLLAFRPDLEIVLLRGNVGTRIEKVKAGDVDATLLALAGLRRLNIEGVVSQIISTNVMLPAVAQGAICVEIREDDSGMRTMFSAINDGDSALCVSVERKFLSVLDGSCHTPIAGLAEVNGDQVKLRALVARPDGTGLMQTKGLAPVSDALAMGAEVGGELKSKMGSNFFKQN